MADKTPSSGTVAREDTLLRGYIPIDEKNVKEIAAKIQEDKAIDFDGNGYVTDALLCSLCKLDIFTEVTSVKLTGCDQVTDYGISCLVHTLKNAKQLKEFVVDGCSKLTDSTFAAISELIKVTDRVKCSMKGTGVFALTNSHVLKVSASGCPDITQGAITDVLDSHVIVFPHADVKKSFSQYLSSGVITERAVGFHQTDVKVVDDWNLTVTELSNSSALAGRFLSCPQTQVVIPFEASADPKSIKNHVMKTIAHVVSQEPRWIEYPEPKIVKRDETDHPWLELYHYTKLNVTIEKTGRQTIGTMGGDKDIGCWLSKQRFTRSHSYIEVKMSADPDKKKGGLLIGCLFDYLYSLRYPMDSNSQIGGFVDVFESQKEEQVVGFGIKGSWISEYVPGDDAEFFYTVDGEEKDGMSNMDNKELMPCGSMYPLFSVIVEGEMTNCTVSLPPTIPPPKEWEKDWKVNSCWLEAGWIDNLILDNYGQLTYLNNYRTSTGEFFGLNALQIGQMFSMEIVEPIRPPDFKPTKKCNLAFGIKQEGKNVKYMIDLKEELVDFVALRQDRLMMSQAYNADTAQVTSGLGEVSGKINVGDIYGLKITNITAEEVSLEFHHNGKKVRDVKVELKSKSKNRILPSITIDNGSQYTVKLRNFRPPVRAEAPIKDKITLGRAHFVNVMDSGEVIYKDNVKDSKMAADKFGFFMPKTPFNKNMLEFSVKILTLSPKQLCGIGVTHPDVSIEKFFMGWMPGTLGYHADNGQVYDNSGSGIQLGAGKQGKYDVGDTVTVKISPVKERAKLKFDQFGNLDSKQTVKVSFFKNGNLMKEINHIIYGASLYPGVTLVDASVQIDNFYAETEEIWYSVRNMDKTEDKIEKPAPEMVEKFKGTEFVVVGLSDGASDPSGKLDIVRQQMDFKDWNQLTKVNSAVTDMEKRLSELDFEGQKQYSELCRVQDNLGRFADTAKQRIRYTAMKLTAENQEIVKQEREGLLKDLMKVETCRKNFQKQNYRLGSTYRTALGHIVKRLATVKVIAFSEMTKEVSELENIRGTALIALLKYAQAKGKLLMLDLHDDSLVVDINFLFSVEEKMQRLHPMEMMSLDTMVTAIGASSHVWTSKQFLTTVLDDLQPGETTPIAKVGLMKGLLQTYQGLVQLRCLRTKTSQKPWVYTLQQNISNPPVPLKSYWSVSKDNTEFVIVKQTYTFPFVSAESVLPLLIANTTKFGRLVLMTAEGIVYHNGAVQSVIVKCCDADGEDSIIIESSCYLPDIEDTKMSKETSTYVRDYVFNTFSIFTDIIDDFLHRANIVTIVTKEYPPDLVKTSVGCKHDWKISQSEFTSQSVCTLCNLCVCAGEECSWNGLMSEQLRHCECQTTTVGCHTCGICRHCADQLWSVRSRLRPHSLSVTKVDKTITEKTRKLTEEEAESHKKELLRDPAILPQFPLDPYMYNEVEFENYSNIDKFLCLKEESDGTIIKAFPGKAAIVKDLQKISSASMKKDKVFGLAIGDRVKLKIVDPFDCTLQSETQESTGPTLQIEPEYFVTVGRECKVIHETGVVVYDSDSQALPVAQLISCRVMTAQNNNFSIKIVNPGDKNTIAVGLAPHDYGANRQPGWNAKSIGYHADDGGIFLESGWPTRKTMSCTTGDVMSIYVDFDKNKGFFRKNGEKCIELNLNPNKLAYYPIIGMHSRNEAVQILEKPLWVPRPHTTEKGFLPPAVSTYKYGNLWISPGDQIEFKQDGRKAAAGKPTCLAWLVLHNPLKDPVGYKVIFKEQCFFGILKHRENCFRDITSTGVLENVYVEWMSLESGRNYTEEDMKALFGDQPITTNQNSHRHTLRSVLKESGNTEIEELPVITETGQKPKNMLALHVYKNDALIEKYELKKGRYQATVESPNNTGAFLFKYPKCPAFTYPRCFQKGMKIVICLEKGNVYAESVVVDVYSGGRSVALEYSPKDKGANMTVCMLTTSPAFNFTSADFDENTATILRYEARSTPDNLVQTFVFAPPYLISEGSYRIQQFLQAEWKSNVLHSVARCSQQFTRITVQEKHVTDAARRILTWGNMMDNKYFFTFLPDQLTEGKLIFPQAQEMFKDINVHRLCFSQTEHLIFSTHLIQHEDVSLDVRVPLHFVDVPGLVPSQPIPVDAMFADVNTVWNYVGLIAHKMILPSYMKLIAKPEGEPSLTRAQVESLLYSMLSRYASLCGIYSATWGGIHYVPANEEKTIKHSVQHDFKKNVLRFDGLPYPVTDTHALVHDNLLSCKAHHMLMSSEALHFGPDDKPFSYEYFEPYSELMTVFFSCPQTVEKLPDDFFEKFPELVYFQLGSSKKMEKFTALPNGIRKAPKLKAIEVNNTAMRELPEDFFMSPSVYSIICTHMPIKALPKTWPKESPLRVLILQGLLLEQIPTEISCLSNLEKLELCYNPLTCLPDSLSNLQKLKELSLVGAPWVRLEGRRNQMSREIYDFFWTQEQPSMKEYIGETGVSAMFDKYDYNHDQILNKEELADLSLELFFKVPRVGINDTNEVTGGIPPVVFKLRSLNTLRMSNNAITMIPASINNLQNLKLLDLSHNPLLESLPGSLGHLPNINDIQIQSCPMLRTPPNEIVSRGFDSVKAYLKRLAGGFTECRRTKLMVVGLGGAGKTSLLRALMSVDKKTSGTEKEIPTDGIDIVPWTVKSEDGQEVTYSTWDFAGQAVYYNTHQFFLSKRAVYLLLWSMRQGYEHAGLDFWLSSICCHAPGTPIIVVGTQCDLIPKAEIPEKELLERYPQIASFHRVSSIQGIGIEDLQKSLLNITLQQGYMGEKIPQVWLNFEKRIIAERLTKKSYIEWKVARQWAMEQGIFDEKDVKMAVQLLHDLGTIQYFDNDFLRDYVVINPQWIVNVMACVVSAQDSPIQKNHGRFLHSDIPVVWKDYDPDLHHWLLRLTEDFDLTFPLPKEPTNIVPCLLPGEPPDDLEWPNVRDIEGVRETKMVYRFAYLPSGLFNRAQVRLFQFSDGKKVWKKGSLLSKNRHLALIKQTDHKELVVYVQGPRPENILFLVHEVFESIIEESFNGVSYELFLPCPDCVTKEGTTDPDLLQAKLIQRAKDLKAPFIQCYKYFHWISMAQLQEKMPSDSREVADFDFQLQQSIVALEELNSDMVTDIAILYSKADVPGPGDSDSLSPALIRDDVLSWGFTCWFAEDMAAVNNVDIATGIKNCKILIAMVSDNFERDDKCRDILIYAKETLDKEIIVVVTGDSMDWENRDLGMKIGKQERKLMAKTMKRYVTAGGRREELQEWLTEKLQAMNKNEVINPDVFISYNWANSRIASDKSLRINESALGSGDPRAIRQQLEREGLHCWIDTQYVGMEKRGIFADMAAGIRNSKVMVVFVSDEYAESDNCMMELRFGILNINLPVVAVIVGTGSEWKGTEVAMLLQRSKASEVFLQKDNPEAVPVIAKFVKAGIEQWNLSNKQKKMKQDKKEGKEKSSKSADKDKSTVAYQEEFELIQRKFMRHILGSDNIPLPRLVVVDFVHTAQHSHTDDGRESQISSKKRPIRKRISKQMLRPKTATKSRDRLQVDDGIEDEYDVEDWSKESFCIKMLCEYEEGWHICKEMYPLAFRNRDLLEVFMKKAAPYLYRIYTILQQSPLKLKCFSGMKGEAFLNWIKLQSEDNLDFAGAMSHLRAELGQDEASEFTSCLARCRLPSGKIVWLCEEHQKFDHVAKLSTGTSGLLYTTKKVLHEEDKLLMNNILDSKQYKDLKGIRSDKTKVDMPDPIPIPAFVPNLPVEPRAPVTSLKTDDKTDNTGKADKTPQESSSGSNQQQKTLTNAENPKEKQETPKQENPKEKQESLKQAETPKANIAEGKESKEINKQQVPESTKDSNKETVEGDKKYSMPNESTDSKVEGNKAEAMERNLRSCESSARGQKVKEIKQEDEEGEIKNGSPTRKDSTNPVQDYQLGPEHYTSGDTQNANGSKRAAEMGLKEKKDEIKRMIVDADAKAINKALRTGKDSIRHSKVNSTRNYAIQPSDANQSWSRNAPGNSGGLVRGSNVKRLNSSGDVTEKANISVENWRTSSKGSLNLEGALNIKTVSSSAASSMNSSTNISPEPSKASGKSEKKQKQVIHPIEKVRPKRIVVKSKDGGENQRNDKKGGSDMNATGKGISGASSVTGKNSTGNKTTSQACSLQ